MNIFKLIQRILLVSTGPLIYLSCNPNPSPENKQLISPSTFFPRERTKVLIVGSFHMDYPNLDEIKTVEADKIDVLIDPKKSELTALVDYIKKFKPNKIAIEATEDWNPTEKLRQYKKGEFRNERDERFQLGMRLATEMGLDTIFAVDEWSFLEELEEQDSIFVEELTKDYDFQSNDPLHQNMKDWYEYNNKIMPSIDMLAYFKHMNSKEYHNYSYGTYLVGDFKSDQHKGPDIISMWWYNRNLRIFRNIQRITENQYDRILLLIGNGHAAVLRHLFEISPEYEVVELGSL